MVLVQLDLVGSSQVPYLTSKIGKGSLGCSSLFPEEAANTPGGEIVVLIQGRGTNGHGEHLPWGIRFVRLVSVHYWGGGTVDAPGHLIQLIAGSKGLEVVQSGRSCLVGPRMIATLA